jgi:hypothetical protein
VAGPRSAIVAFALAVATSCGSAATTPIAAQPSPTVDTTMRDYVALIHTYWMQELAADDASNGANLAARVCLGMDPPGTPTDLQLVDPAACHDRATAILANAQWFLAQLDRTPAPPRFAQDDRAFRDQLPKAIADLIALIAATQSGNKDDVVKAATAYNNDMYPIVTDALNDVDPSVKHP